jgi:hypothetical protein
MRIRLFSLLAIILFIIGCEKSNYSNRGTKSYDCQQIKCGLSNTDGEPFCMTVCEDSMLYVLKVEKRI